MNFSGEAFLHQQAIQARCIHPTGEWTALPYAALDGSIAARFEAMVAHYPERLAVQMDDQQLSYTDLNEQANRVAHALLAQQGDPAQPVILLFDHTPAAVIAMLGVLKAGRFYTPFDPTQPPPRLRQKAQDSQADLILTDCQQLALATKINGSGATILRIEQCLATQLGGESANLNPNLRIHADANALLLYTSGSTGEPKGILLSQRALLHRVKRQMEIVHLSCEDRCACLHSYEAMAGLRDLFCPLLSGAATCLFNLKTRALTALPTWVQQTRITILGFVTPTLRLLLNQIPLTTAFAQVRLICIGGDTLYRQDVESYRQHFPPTCILYNSLGATETAGGFCYYLFEHQHALPADPLPVGYPMIDMQITIVDAAGEPVACGEIGEIALTTPYLAQGYWRQPAQTGDRFRPASVGATYLTGDSGLLQADNCLVQLGRKDNQVKLHGYRVEMGEIERNLLTHHAVQEAAVVVYRHGAGEGQLVAYWVARLGLAATAQTLRQWLLTLMPAPMVPTRFVLLDALPLTPSGKIDRRALVTLGDKIHWDRVVVDQPYQPPRTPLEAQLVTIWEAVLGVRPVGIADHFLDLGGNSLRAMQVHARLNSQLPTEIPARLLFAGATIGELALQITQEQAIQADPAALAQILAAVEAAPEPAGQRQRSSTGENL